MKESSINGVVNQLKEDIDQVSRQTKGLKNGERFKSVKKLNDLRSILDRITEINQSVDDLMNKQIQKRDNHE